MFRFLACLLSYKRSFCNNVRHGPRPKLGTVCLRKVDCLNAIHSGCTYCSASEYCFYNCNVQFNLFLA